MSPGDLRKRIGIVVALLLSTSPGYTQDAGGGGPLFQPRIALGTIQFRYRELHSLAWGGGIRLRPSPRFFFEAEWLNSRTEVAFTRRQTKHLGLFAGIGTRVTPETRTSVHFRAGGGWGLRKETAIPAFGRRPPEEFEESTTEAFVQAGVGASQHFGSGFVAGLDVAVGRLGDTDYLLVTLGVGFEIRGHH